MRAVFAAVYLFVSVCVYLCFFWGVSSIRLHSAITLDCHTLRRLKHATSTHAFPTFISCPTAIRWVGPCTAWTMLCIRAFVGCGAAYEVKHLTPTLESPYPHSLMSPVTRCQLLAASKPKHTEPVLRVNPCGASQNIRSQF